MTAILAGFESEEALRSALVRLRDLPGSDIETYTPTVLEAADAHSPLPLAMFIAGILGFIGFFLLMSYADVRAYPLDIGGRPLFAWPAFVPIAFELGVLCAMSAGFFGYFFVCRLPQPYDPVDECEGIRRALRDGWLVAIRCGDSADMRAARSLLDELRPVSVEEFSP
jgi:hypothetical protein